MDRGRVHGAQTIERRPKLVVEIIGRGRQTIGPVDAEIPMGGTCLRFGRPVLWGMPQRDERGVAQWRREVNLTRMREPLGLRTLGARGGQNATLKRGR